MSTVIGRGGRGSPYGSLSTPGDSRPPGKRARRKKRLQESRTEVPAHKGNALTHAFTKFSGTTANAMGTPWAFLVAFAVIVVWGVTGPLFGFSDTWQLVINTGTTIVTFLMVFLIQNTQNRDAKALHIKLDELIRAVEAAHNDIIDVEDADDEELNALQERFRKERERARREEDRRGSAA
jgi:low affinity Fe/Cu permease